MGARMAALTQTVSKLDDKLTNNMQWVDKLQAYMP